MDVTDKVDRIDSSSLQVHSVHFVMQEAYRRNFLEIALAWVKSSR